jgi:hypothetical protein
MSLSCNQRRVGYVLNDNVVGVATCYEMDGLGFETQWGAKFSALIPELVWTLWKRERTFVPVGDRITGFLVAEPIAKSLYRLRCPDCPLL